MFYNSINNLTIIENFLFIFRKLMDRDNFSLNLNLIN